MKQLFRHIPVGLPIVSTLRGYDRSQFRGDLNAGLIVAIMLVPQGMAYAVLAGLPPVYGLYASIVPLLAYAVLGTSRQLAVGPVAMVSLLVAAGVGEIAGGDPERFIRLAVLTAFGVGVVQFLMGLMRLGFLVNFLSHPVLSGFTSAAAVIIAVSQLPALSGIGVTASGSMIGILPAVLMRITEAEPATLMIAAGSLITLIWARRSRLPIPGAILVVVLGTALTALFGLDRYGVAIVGEVPAGLPALSVGLINAADLQLLIPVILVISLVSYMESIAVAKSIANRRGYKVDPNQELIALGSANLAGSLFHSFPVTGGFSRTAVNDQSGARSTVATLITALLVTLTVLFLTPFFHYLPKAVLAAIIVTAVAGLFDGAEFRTLWRSDRRDFAMLMVTFVATLLVGIEEGILLGVILSLVMVIYSSTKPHQAELGRLGESGNFRNIERYKDAGREPEILIHRFDSSLYFANVEHFREKLEQRISRRGAELKLIVLDASAIHEIDSSGIRALRTLVNDLRQRRMELYLAGVIGPVRDKLKLSGMLELLGGDNFFFDVNDAVIHFRHRGEEEIDRRFSPLQSNW